MMNNLGKIFFLTLIPFLLFAEVSIDVPKSFYKGDRVVFTIKARGADVVFPDITKIENYSVQSGGRSSSTTIINGVKSQRVSKSFIFRPSKTVTIPSFEIKVDGKTERTKAQTVLAKTVQKTDSPYYSLDINVDKKTAYVGEEIVFNLKFKFKEGLQLVDLEFLQPDFEGFWVKELKGGEKKKEAGFVVQEINYLLFPQKEGKVTIDPLKINLHVMDNSTRGYGFFSQVLTEKIPVYSNEIKLDIKPLPGGVILTGDFTVKGKIDKNYVDEGEAVSYTLVVKGRGNLDDIGEIKLDIPGTTIYDNPSKKEFNIKQGRYGGVYTKTYSIVSSKDFTIPKIELNYFDKKTKTVKSVQTKPYKIKVKSIEKTSKPKLEVSPEPKEQQPKSSGELQKRQVAESSFRDKIIYFLLGVLTAFIFILGYFGFVKRAEKTEDTPFEKQIKNAKTKDELFKLLVVYINIDEQLDKMIFDLEKSKKEDLKPFKKEVLKLLKDKRLEL